jgi:hypothetical protein
VSTVRRDEAAIRVYIRNREQEDSHLKQLSLWRRFGHLQVANYYRIALATLTDRRFERPIT